MAGSEDKTHPEVSARTSTLPYRPFGRTDPISRPAIVRPGSRRTLRPSPRRVPRKKVRVLPPVGLLVVVALLSFGVAFAASSLLGTPTPTKSQAPTPVTVSPDAPPAVPATVPSPAGATNAQPAPTTTVLMPGARTPTQEVAPIQLLDRRRRRFTPKRVSDLKTNPFFSARPEAAPYVLSWRKVSDLKANPFL